METILLVEDSRFLRIANERVLSKAGYQVITAADGEEALSLATSMVPDLILLDMLLPKLAGPQVLQAIRKDPRTASIPVIVLSSLPQSNEPQLKRDGATAYFAKSNLDLEISSDALIEIVSEALKGNVALISGNYSRGISQL